MVNALIPEDRVVGVMSQTRDPRQQEIRIEYSVGPRWAARLQWLVVAVAGLSTLTVIRRRKAR